MIFRLSGRSKKEKLYIYLLFTAIGLVPGGSVYNNKETTLAFHENSTIHFHSKIQVHEHYRTQQKTENTKENTEKTEPGPSSYSSSLRSLSYPNPVM
jgi:hypothetical protein